MLSNIFIVLKWNKIQKASNIINNNISTLKMEIVSYWINVEKIIETRWSTDFILLYCIFYIIFFGNKFMILKNKIQ